MFLFFLTYWKTSAGTWKTYDFADAIDNSEMVYNWWQDMYHLVKGTEV